jgi:hypothetical protein
MAALLITVLILVGSFLAGIAGNVIASELYDRLPTLAHWLIRRAVARLPLQYRARYREEWCAHLEQCRGHVNKIRHALGCFLGARSVAASQIIPWEISEIGEFRHVVLVESEGGGGFSLRIASGLGAESDYLMFRSEMSWFLSVHDNASQNIFT